MVGKLQDVLTAAVVIGSAEQVKMGSKVLPEPTTELSSEQAVRTSAKSARSIISSRKTILSSRQKKNFILSPALSTKRLYR